MATRTESAGKCNSCGAVLSKRQMIRHLSQCAYPDVKNTAAVIQLRVDAPGTPFWLDLDVKSNATLRRVDEFLRSIWLECCDHLSEFVVGRVRYVETMSDGFLVPDPHERSMDTRVSAGLPPAGKAFSYEYDYGSTTRLRLLVIAHRQAVSRQENVRLLARNEEPRWLCSECGGAATALCGSCFHEGEAFVCGAHAEDHKCGDEAMLPIVNSPRMGVCGYTGGA